MSLLASLAINFFYIFTQKKGLDLLLIVPQHFFNVDQYFPNTIQCLFNVAQCIPLFSQCPEFSQMLFSTFEVLLTLHNISRDFSMLPYIPWCFLRPLNASPTFSWCYCYPRIDRIIVFCISNTPKHFFDVTWHLIVFAIIPSAPTYLQHYLTSPSSLVLFPICRSSHRKKTSCDIH